MDTTRWLAGDLLSCPCDVTDGEFVLAFVVFPVVMLLRRLMRRDWVVAGCDSNCMVHGTQYTLLVVRRYGVYLVFFLVCFVFFKCGGA